MYVGEAEDDPLDQEPHERLLFGGVLAVLGLVVAIAYAWPIFGAMGGRTDQLRFTGGAMCEAKIDRPIRGYGVDYKRDPRIGDPRWARMPISVPLMPVLAGLIAAAGGFGGLILYRSGRPRTASGVMIAAVFLGLVADCVGEYGMKGHAYTGGYGGVRPAIEDPAFEPD